MTRQERIKKGQEIFDKIRENVFQSLKEGKRLTHVIVSAEDQQCVIEWAFEEMHLNPITDSGTMKLAGLEFIGGEDAILRL